MYKPEKKKYFLIIKSTYHATLKIRTFTECQKNYSVGTYIKNNYTLLSNHMIFKRTKNKKYSSNVMKKKYTLNFSM